MRTGDTTRLATAARGKHTHIHKHTHRERETTLCAIAFSSITGERRTRHHTRHRTIHRIVETRVKVRRLSSCDIEAYLEGGEWEGKAGGYAIQGAFAAHVIALVGSYSSVVGLPLYETVNLLRGAGWAPPDCSVS